MSAIADLLPQTPVPDTSNQVAQFDLMKRGALELLSSLPPKVREAIVSLTKKGAQAETSGKKIEELMGLSRKDVQHPYFKGEEFGAYNINPGEQIHYRSPFPKETGNQPYLENRDISRLTGEKGVINPDTSFIMQGRPGPGTFTPQTAQRMEQFSDPGLRHGMLQTPDPKEAQSMLQTGDPFVGTYQQVQPLTKSAPGALNNMIQGSYGKEGRGTVQSLAQKLKEALPGGSAADYQAAIRQAAIGRAAEGKKLDYLIATEDPTLVQEAMKILVDNLGTKKGAMTNW